MTKASISVPSMEKWSLDISFLTRRCTKTAESNFAAMAPYPAAAVEQALFQARRMLPADQCFDVAGFADALVGLFHHYRRRAGDRQVEELARTYARYFVAVREVNYPSKGFATRHCGVKANGLAAQSRGL